MDGLIELVLGFIALGIYGTEDRPRHPALRQTVRGIAFGGAAVLLAWLLGLPLGEGRLLAWLSLIAGPVWAVCIFLILFAEPHAGSRRVAVAGWLCVPMLVLAALA